MENFVILGVLLIFMMVAWGAWHGMQRNKGLVEWVNEHGFRLWKGRHRGFDTRYPGFEILAAGNDRYAVNVVEGDWNGWPMTCFDYVTVTYYRDKDGKQKQRRSQVSAAIVQCHFPLKPLFIRPEGMFDKVTEFFGGDDIDLESAEFSRKFYVKAHDRKWAYDVLQSSTMEFLLDSPKFTMEFGKHAVLAYTGDTMDVEEFEGALTNVTVMLDRLPNFVVEQQKALMKGQAPFRPVRGF